MKKIHKSKISYGFILIVFLLIGILGYQPLTSGVDWYIIVILFSPVILVAMTFNSIKYNIQHDELIIKSGFFTNKRIKITSIRKIVETTNIISAPAASFDRLEIIYNTYDSIEISPSNKQNFIDDLLAIHSNIEIKYKTPQ